MDEQRIYDALRLLGFAINDVKRIRNGEVHLADRTIVMLENVYATLEQVAKGE